MKSFIIKISLVPLLLFCNSSDCHSQQSNFFEFDEVNYYSTNISNKEVMELVYAIKKNKLVYKKKNKREMILFEILRKNYPDSHQMNLSRKLLQNGFKKKYIDKSLYPNLNNIFSEKECDENYAGFCIPTFRDILVFKKNNKTIGVAKICFSCKFVLITGTDKNYRNFGGCRDFNKLDKLIR